MMAHTVDNNFCHTTSTSVTKYQLVPPSTDLVSPATKYYCIMLTHYHPFCPFLPKTDLIPPITEQVPPSGDPIPRGTVFYSPVLTPKPPSTVTRSAVYYCQDGPNTAQYRPSVVYSCPVLTQSQPVLSKSM